MTPTTPPPDEFDAVAALLDALGFGGMAAACRKDRFRADLPNYAKVIAITARRDRLPQADAIRSKLRTLKLLV